MFMSLGSTPGFMSSKGWKFILSFMEPFNKKAQQWAEDPESYLVDLVETRNVLIPPMPDDEF